MGSRCWDQVLGRERCPSFGHGSAARMWPRFGPRRRRPTVGVGPVSPYFGPENGPGFGTAFFGRWWLCGRRRRKGLGGSKVWTASNTRVAKPAIARGCGTGVACRCRAWRGHGHGCENGAVERFSKTRAPFCVIFRGLQGGSDGRVAAAGKWAQSFEKVCRVASEKGKCCFGPSGPFRAILSALFASCLSQTKVYSRKGFVLAKYQLHPSNGSGEQAIFAKCICNAILGRFADALFLTLLTLRGLFWLGLLIVPVVRVCCGGFFSSCRGEQKRGPQIAIFSQFCGPRFVPIFWAQNSDHFLATPSFLS